MTQKLFVFVQIVNYRAHPRVCFIIITHIFGNFKKNFIPNEKNILFFAILLTYNTKNFILMALIPENFFENSSYRRISNLKNMVYNKDINLLKQIKKLEEN